MQNYEIIHAIGLQTALLSAKYLKMMIVGNDFVYYPHLFLTGRWGQSQLGNSFQKNTMIR